MRKLRVGVFEEQEIFRRGLVACLREDDDMEVIVDAPGAAASDLDVAVTSQAASKCVPPGCPTVICVDRDDGHSVTPEDVFAVLPRRTLDPEQLNVAVRAAAVHLHVQGPEATNGNGLTERMISVLRMLASGMGTKEISEGLGYSERTIKGVLSDLQRDLGTRTRAQTVAEALRQQLI